MMDPPHQVVLDISSDDEQLPPSSTAADADFDWLREVLEAFNKEQEKEDKDDDDDDVVVVGEYKPPPPKPKKSKSSSDVTVNVTVDDNNDDDDDCVVLDGDPEAGGECGGGGDDDDDVCVIGQKGQIACRDYAHSRHLCAKFHFSSSPHEQHCEMCHCYVCDSLAPCPYWGTGVSSSDHCHATDKESVWKLMRESFRARRNGSPVVSKLVIPPPSVLVPQTILVPSIDLISPTSSIQQNEVTRPMVNRACSSSTRFPTQNIMRHNRNERLGFLRARYPCPRRSVPHPALHVVGRQFKHSTVGIWKPNYAPSMTSKRPYFIGNPLAMNKSICGSANNLNYAPGLHCLSNNSPLSLPADITNSWQQNILPSTETETHSYCSSSLLNRGAVCVDVVPTQPEVSSQPKPSSNHKAAFYQAGSQNQSQNVAGSGFPEFDVGWENILSQCNKESSAENNQLHGTGSNADTSSCDQFGSLFTESTPTPGQHQ